MIETIKFTQEVHLSDIVRNYGKHLKKFIRKRVRSTEDAEDILQDVFYRLVEADRLMKPIEQVSAWLFMVARNRIIDLYRKKKPEPLTGFLSDDVDEEMAGELRDFLQGEESTSENQYLESLIWTVLKESLEELPQEQRLVFELNELEGMPFKKIAELTGEPVNTLISRKRYAILHLRERLKPLYNELLNL